LGDLLWWFFGWWFGWWRSKVRKWEDLKKIIEISFEDSYLGCEKKISYTRMKKVSWATEEVCPNCNGRWKVSQQAQTPFGVMQTSSACKQCGWIWKIYKKGWKILENGWLEEVKETIDIKIPAWIKEDAYIKYSWKWDAGIGDAPDGDLYLKIRIIPNKKYHREWDDLYVKASVTVFDLVLWWEVEVSHPEWKLMVKIPKWTQVWDKIKVAGRWFGEKWLFKSKWDMIVETEVSIPKKLSKDEENLWKKLRDGK
jgi:molecular chaperone DnaJ